MIQKNTLNSKIFIQDILTSDDVVDSIKNNLDELLEIIPEIKKMIGFEHNHPHHHLDVWNHTLIDGEERNFKGHTKVSKEISSSILKRLNYTDKFIGEVCYLIEKHDDIITSDEIKNNYALAYKRYLIQQCDALAHHPEKLEKRIKYLEKKKMEFEVARKK